MHCWCHITTCSPPLHGHCFRDIDLWFFGPQTRSLGFLYIDHVGLRLASVIFDLSCRRAQLHAYLAADHFLGATNKAVWLQLRFDSIRRRSTRDIQSFDCSSTSNDRQIAVRSRRTGVKRRAVESNQIKSHLFVSVASIARFHSAIDKMSAMKTIK